MALIVATTSAPRHPDIRLTKVNPIRKCGYAKLYKQNTVKERHRHCYELNNDYRDQIEKAGLVVSGVNQQANLVEIVELPQHPFFVGCQFHPEFISRPQRPHPLYQGFIAAVVNRLPKQSEFDL